MTISRHSALRGFLSRISSPPRGPGVLAWCIIAIASVALFSVSVPTTISIYATPVAATFLVYTLLCASILLAARLPWIAAALGLAGIAGLVAVMTQLPDEDWPLPATGLLALCALLAVLGIWGNWIFAIVAWWAAIVVILVVAAINSRHDASLKQWQDALILISSISALVLGLSITLGQRQRIRTQLAAAKRDVELEHARRQHVEERARIAREMHDVVVHSMSLVHIQASSAPYRLAGLDEPTRAEFENIARSARSALGEMRQVLGVLRPDSEADAAPLAPQPQLADLHELALVTSRAGSPVALTVHDEANRSSPLVQLTCYRIVQEALGNVLRHAPGATATVIVSARAETVLVEITNTAPPLAPRHRRAEDRDRGGRGLSGMRERAEQLRGRIETGPSVDGGFCVAAFLPLNAATEGTVLQ